MLCIALLCFGGQPSRTEHTALKTRAFWAVSQMFPDPSPPPCLCTWPNSHLWELASQTWRWDTVTLYDEVFAGSHGKWTCDFDFICTCSVTGQSEQRPVKTAGSSHTSTMHRTRRKMVLTAGQQEQQLAPHLSCHQPLILWFLQYLLCHPSNCWLVWNSSPFNE